jgi:hypothetical protein
MESVPQGKSGAFRRQLQISVSAAAAPYGYTLVIFSSGSLAEDAIGSPHLPQVLLYLGGAVLGFIAVELPAFGRLQVRLRRPGDQPLEAWGYAHVLSAGLAVMIAWVALRVVDTTIGWALVGFLATAAYLTVNAVQTLLARKAAERPDEGCQ